MKASPELMELFRLIVKTDYVSIFAYPDNLIGVEFWIGSDRLYSIETEYKDLCGVVGDYYYYTFTELFNLITFIEENLPEQVK